MGRNANSFKYGRELPHTMKSSRLVPSLGIYPGWLLATVAVTVLVGIATPGRFWTR